MTTVFKLKRITLFELKILPVPEMENTNNNNKNK
jgi:hypothetical protein